MPNEYVVYKPGLLNARETFTVQLLLDAERAAVTVEARIEGLSRPIGDIDGMGRAKERTMLKWIYAVAIALTAGFVMLALSVRGREVTDKVAFIAALLAGGLAVFAFSLTAMKSLRATSRDDRLSG